MPPIEHVQEKVAVDWHGPDFSISVHKEETVGATGFIRKGTCEVMEEGAGV